MRVFCPNNEVLCFPFMRNNESPFKMFDFYDLGNVVVGSLLRSDGMSSQSTQCVCAYECKRFS